MSNYFKVFAVIVIYNIIGFFYFDGFEKPIEIAEISRDYKTIVLWTNFSNSKNWNIKVSDLPDYFEKRKCPETRCKIVLTTQRDMYPETEYDAVVFNGHKLERGDKLPEKRLSHQVYVFVEMEPVFPWWQFKVNFNVTFNLTMTFKLDSDIFTPYYFIQDKFTNAPIAPSYYVKWRKFESNFTDESLLKMAGLKNRTMVAVISHCSPMSARKNLTENLKNLIDFDVFGRCGKHKCPSTSYICTDSIAKNYKFYGAFENSLCKDYVTEKFYSALERNIVPVVYGACNYSNFAPPHSYIDIGDFSSIEKLTDYLRFLSENPKEYVKYFWWKKYYTVKGSHVDFCKLCQHLHKPASLKRHKIYKNMKEYWSDNACLHTSRSSRTIDSFLYGTTRKLKKNIKRTLAGL